MNGDRNVSGKDAAEEALWHTYVFRAWQAAAPVACRAGYVYRSPTPYSAKPENRISAEEEEALCLILFAAFLLEYRMRATLTLYQKNHSKLQGLGQLADAFWERLKGLDRRDRSGQCEKPAGWRRSGDWPELRELRRFRDKMAHGQYGQIVALLQQGPQQLGSKACELYNFVLSVIQMIGDGTGYGTEIDQMRLMPVQQSTEA